jgi:tetratricopeptide (TPR) repeat protein
MGMIYSSSGEIAAAHAHYAQAADVFLRTLGDQNPRTASAVVAASITGHDLLTGTGPELASRVASIVDTVSAGASAPTTSLNNAGFMLWQRGEDDAAAIVYRKVLSLTEAPGQHGATGATVLNNLAMVAQRRRDYREALELFGRAGAELDKPDGNRVLRARVLNNTGLLCYQMGDLAGARDLLGQALAQRLELLGADSPDTAITRHNLALLAARDSDQRAAAEQMRQALDTSVRALGERNPQVARIRRELGILLHSAAQLSEALAIEREALPPRHPDLIETLDALGDLASEQTRADDATQFWTEARDISELRFGSEHSRTQEIEAKLGTGPFRTQI